MLSGTEGSIGVKPTSSAVLLWVFKVTLCIASFTGYSDRFSFKPFIGVIVVELCTSEGQHLQPGIVTGEPDIGFRRAFILFLCFVTVLPLLFAMGSLYS